MALGVQMGDLDTIDATYPCKPSDCLRSVLERWVRKGYCVERHGPPTWQKVVEAVARPAGGNDNALAEGIAKSHQGKEKGSLQFCALQSNIIFSTVHVDVSSPSKELVSHSTTESEVQAQMGQQQWAMEQTPSTQLVQMKIVSHDSFSRAAVECPSDGSDDEGWDLSTRFAAMFGDVIELFNQTLQVEKLRRFLGNLSHPRTPMKSYIDPKLYEKCSSTAEVLDTLCPQYINFMHTSLLRRIVRIYGTEDIKKLLHEYEDSLPRKQPLKRLGHPLSDEDIEGAIGVKRLKVVYDKRGASVETTTMEDIESFQDAIERNTGIDRVVIVYAKQTPGSVIFTFLIPDSVATVFSDLTIDNRKDLAGSGIQSLEVDGVVVDLNLSTYTAAGIKRVPLKQSPETVKWNHHFEQFTSKFESELLEEPNKLKEFLLNQSHILYPEFKYINTRLLSVAASVEEIFSALSPQYMNYLNWSLLLQIADTFNPQSRHTIEEYTSQFPPSIQLTSLPDPLSEEEIVELHGVKRLTVTCGGGGSDWTLGDVWLVQEVLEKATGIDRGFLPFANWEPSYSLHDFTFLIPTSAVGILEELCKEDLEILANCGIRSIDIDYCLVLTISKETDEVAQLPIQVQDETRVRTKDFGLEHLIPEDKMNREELSHLTNLITSTPPGKLQKKCLDEDLHDLAKSMQSWKDLAPYFGVNEWRVEELEENYPNEDDQKYLALLCWKRMDPSTATYEGLVECLLRHGHVRDAGYLLGSLSLGK